ncbi:hypothetical protein [Haloglomus litoreum]|uniref:hypothetical protein n=1 Tax=Haloglomus litoreum TaxID=3034026 RepID=UPI0023E8F682|nr:hypothetical protein [Haloglomus sp. DT116]
MTHGTQYAGLAVPAAFEQELRERDWDRSWGAIEALRETGHLAPVATYLLLAAVTIYAGALGVRGNSPVAGLALAVGGLVGFGLMIDTTLCKGTPAHVHECRRCRRATDRWRGPTRDGQWIMSILGQPSAAEATPAAQRYGRSAPEPWTWPEEADPAVREVSVTRSAAADPPSSIDGTQPSPPNGGAGD